MTIKEKLFNILFRNVGVVKIDGKEYIRSGHAKWIRRWFIYKIYKPKTIINLSHTCGEDEDERKWAEERKISYFGYSLSAGGPRPEDAARIPSILTLAKIMPRPWIHCQGGKDRTGGIVGMLQARAGVPWLKIIKDWKPWYGTPAEKWIWAIQDELK